MRYSIISTVCFAGWALGEKINISFDKALEGRVGLHQVVEEVQGKVSLGSKTKPNLAHLGNGKEGHLDARDLLGFTPAEDLVGRDDLDARQLYCDPGYGYCSDFGRCCPNTGRCCSFGYCMESGQTCCPSGPCPAGNVCCGTQNCMEAGAVCCRDGSHCPAGNGCYIVEGYSDMRCCTNSRCTAYIDETGSTSMADITTTTRTFTTTSSQYYYWTITWSYYYYYWSYEVQYSYVTSTYSTTSTTYSVRTTDAAAASEYFSSLSETVTLPTPAAATSLESLAGQTIADETRVASGAATGGSDNDNNDNSGEETSASSSGDTTGQNAGQGQERGGGGGENAASRLLGAVDRFTTLFLSFGVAVGAMAIWL